MTGYSFHKSVSLVFFEESCQIKTPGDSFTIEGGAAVIRTLFDYLSNPRQDSEAAIRFLTDHLGSVEKSTQLVEFLKSKHILVDSSTNDFTTQYDAVLDYMNRNVGNLDDPHPPLKNLRNAQLIYLDGDGRVSEVVATILREKGFQVDSSPNEAEILIDIGYERTVESRLEKNRQFYRYGKPYLMANASEAEINIGPMVIPGISSCYHCVYQRAYANAAYKNEFLGTQDDRATVQGMDPVVATLYAGLLANEIIKTRLRDTSCQLIDRTLQVRLTQSSSVTRPVVKAPRCEVCGRQSHRPLYAIRNMM